MSAVAAAIPTHGARRVAAIHSHGACRLAAGCRPWFPPIRFSASAPLPIFSSESDSSETPPPKSLATSRPSFFPKRGQTLELVCETLAFKGKGVCKADDTGFVLICDRALPGERFLGRVSRKKGNYAEVTKLRTITPHQDAVEAPCEYASDCGGCKTQNLLYEAQLRAKEQQVRDLILRVGMFGGASLDIFKPIVPCSQQFHYRNKMEFSFGTRRWRPKDTETGELSGEEGRYTLGLHAPGFFDKVLQIDKCLLQSEAANKLFKMVGVIQI